MKYVTCSLLSICVVSYPAYAKYCVKLPTCEELGYIFPNKEGRNQIKCPFDTSKVLYLDYCQAYGITQPNDQAGQYQECIEQKADGTKINTGFYRYTRCNAGYSYNSGNCELTVCDTNYDIGDIYYYNDVPIGVVYYADTTTTKIVALNNINTSGTEGNSYMHWTTSSSSDYYDIPDLTNYTSTSTASEDMDGKSNTSTILSYAVANNKTVQAATATSKYAPSVCASGSMCGKGEWYLPALGELQKMYDNLSTIDSALSNAGGTILNHDSYYYFWSSTETSADYAWIWGFSNILWNIGDKYNGNGYVRPCLEINRGGAGHDVSAHGVPNPT